jgi:phosphoglycolate phosphatase
MSRTAMPRLLLFDIDGTLLLTKGASLRAMKAAARDLHGDAFRWEGIETSGGLDPVLFATAARQSGVPVTRADHDVFRERYHEHLSVELRTHAHDIVAMPVVHEVLRTLRTREDIVLGLLTGNYARAAALKLTAIGVATDWFRLAVFGDEGGSRPELGAVALGKYRELTGAPIEPDRVVVIGDTPHDVGCARANGFRAFAVATGKFSAEDLARSGAHHAAADLSGLVDWLRD